MLSSFGLFMMLGFLARSFGLILAGLSWGIGFGGGWLGSTCVDKWQIASVEGAATFMFVFTDGRWLSIDQLLYKNIIKELKSGNLIFRYGD
jgi:thiosulfate dehydrogenase [quinone] large subunit